MLFVSLQYKEQIKKKLDYAEIITDIFEGSSVILMIFAAIFISYSNSFFIKKRKKEIILYSLLGVPKRKIGTMLFYENFIMGSIALVIGIGIGGLLSKLFAMVLLRLMEFPTNLSFSISKDAVLYTIIVFAIIIFVTSLHGYRIIYQFKLSELIQVEKENKYITKSSPIIVILGICLLTCSYWLLNQPTISSIWLGHYIRNICFVIGSSIIGTYFIFSDFIILVLVSLQKYKKRYYRGINVVGVSQLLSRIQVNAKTLTAITLLSTITVCIIGTVSIVFYEHSIMIDKKEPFSFLYKKTETNVDQEIENTIQKFDHTIQKKIAIPLIKLKADLHVNNFMPIYFRKNPYDLNLLSESTFHTLSDTLKKDIKISLQHTEAVALDTNKSKIIQTDYTGGEAELYLSNKDYTLQFVEEIQDNILNESLQEFTIVVSDKAFSEIAKQHQPYILQPYKVSDDKNMKELTKSIQKIIPEKAKLTVKYTSYKESIEVAGLMIFVGVFLGIVFLAATGSILYFKQVTEAVMSHNTYVTLRKLGVSKQMIFKSIAKQVAFIFILPLCIGIVYSIVILKMLSNIIGFDIFIPVLTTIVAYTLVYFAYYILTLKSYNNAVNK